MMARKRYQPAREVMKANAPPACFFSLALEERGGGGGIVGVRAGGKRERGRGVWV